MVSARNRTASLGFAARAAPTAMAMTALDEISVKVMKVINTMLKTSVCFGHSGLILRMKPYAIKKAANVNASEIIKIHIMNLLHDVPNGDLPPPQSEASIRCCSAARLESIELQSPECVYDNNSKTNKYIQRASMTCQYMAHSLSGSK